MDVLAKSRPLDKHEEPTIVSLNENILRPIDSQSSVNVATFQNILRKQNKVVFLFREPPNAQREWIIWFFI